MSTGVEGKKAEEDNDHRLQKASSVCKQMKGDKRGMLHQLHSPGDPVNTVSNNKSGILLHATLDLQFRNLR
jgi:hypothetical protein